MITQKVETGTAYSIWFYSILIIGDISGKVSLEMRTGTFEQMYLSSISIPILFIAKALVAILRAFLIMTSLLAFFWSFGYVNFSLLQYKTIYILIITTIGLFGISFFICGLTILIKDTSWLINIVNNGLLFLSGIFLPLDFFSSQLQRVLLMIPTTQAIKSLYQQIDLFNDLIPMIFLNSIYFILGISFFLFCEKKAKMKGILGHY